MRQGNFFKTNWKHRLSHGGSLRNARAGRKARPLSSRQPIHLVFKANLNSMQGGFRNSRRFALIHRILRKYAKHFWIKIDQVSIQNDHIHFLIRAKRRAQLSNFFRVFAGQVAQQFEKEGLLTAEKKSSFLKQSSTLVNLSSATGTPKQTSNFKRQLVKLWKYRPFTRVVVGWKAYRIAKNYIRLNEQEALDKISYQKNRLKRLSSSDWEVLWS